METLIFGLIVALITLSIPFLIVGFWQKRPRFALIIASLLAFIILCLPKLIQTLQAMMIYGTGDPQLMAGGISEAIVKALIWMIIIVPLLIVFQRLMRSWRLSKAQKIELWKNFD